LTCKTARSVVQEKQTEHVKTHSETKEKGEIEYKKKKKKKGKKSIRGKQHNRFQDRFVFANYNRMHGQSSLKSNIGEGGEKKKKKKNGMKEEGTKADKAR
jgi:hypothetical protein